MFKTMAFKFTNKYVSFKGSSYCSKAPISSWSKTIWRNSTFKRNVYFQLLQNKYRASFNNNKKKQPYIIL